MIICLLRTFLENALKKQNFPFSPLSLHCACMSVGNSVFFFFKLAAPMHALFFKVARSPFKQKYGTALDTVKSQNIDQGNALGLQGFEILKILYVSLNPAKWAGYPRISGQDIRFLRCLKHLLALGLKFHAYCG